MLLLCSNYTVLCHGTISFKIHETFTSSPSRLATSWPWDVFNLFNVYVKILNEKSEINGNWGLGVGMVIVHQTFIVPNSWLSVKRKSIGRNEVVRIDSLLWSWLNQIMYSDLSNKRSACSTNFSKNESLHGPSTSCMFY